MTFAEVPGFEVRQNPAALLWLRDDRVRVRSSLAWIEDGAALVEAAKRHL